MTPLELSCRVCDAQSGDPCTYVEDGQVTMVEVVTGYHHERIEDAAAMTQNASPVSPEEFTSAVEKSGRV